jgi:hypothetical protein
VLELPVALDVRAEALVPKFTVDPASPSVAQLTVMPVSPAKAVWICSGVAACATPMRREANTYSKTPD